MINRVGPSESASSEVSDVYNFGAFLMELITGQETLDIGSLGSNESLFQWVSASTFSDSFLIALNSVPCRNIHCVT